MGWARKEGKMSKSISDELDEILWDFKSYPKIDDAKQAILNLINEARIEEIDRILDHFSNNKGLAARYFIDRLAQLKKGENDKQN